MNGRNTVSCAPTNGGSHASCLPANGSNCEPPVHLQQNALPREIGSSVVVSVYLPELQCRKRQEFDIDENLWIAKIRLLSSLDKGLVRDGLNCGFYLPPANGRAGKFLDDERPLRDYSLVAGAGGAFLLEFKHKRRVYRQMLVSISKHRRLHSHDNLKQLMSAVKGYNVEKASKLLGKGLDPNFHDADTGETPLTMAATLKDCREMILALVGGGGAHIDYRNQQSLTPMHIAAATGNGEAIMVMLELGASPNSKDRKGLTPLFYVAASKRGSLQCAELLLRDYATTGSLDQRGYTELHQACKNGHSQLVEMLVFYGADMNAKDLDGWTPLHVSIATNQMACLRMLLLRGADKCIANYGGQTPAMMAHSSGNLEATGLLEGHEDLLIRPFTEPPPFNPRRRLAGTNLLTALSAQGGSRLSLSASLLSLPCGDYRDLLRSTSLMSRSYYSKPVSGNAGNDAWPPGTRASLGHLSLYLPRQRHSIASEAGNALDTSGDDYWECSTSYNDRIGGPGPKDMFSATSRSNLDDVKVEAKPPNGTAVDERKASVSQQATSFSGGDRVKLVALSKEKKGCYGFVLRGAKSAQLKKAKTPFVPTEQTPALQHLDGVEGGSMAEKAGLKPGDFVVEINGVNVVQTSHEDMVQMIKRSGNTLVMRVVTPLATAVATPAADGTSIPASRDVVDDSLRAVPGHLMAANGGSLSHLDENQAIDQLDKTLASYESQSSLTAAGGSTAAEARSRLPSVTAACGSMQAVLPPLAPQSAPPAMTQQPHSNGAPSALKLASIRARPSSQLFVTAAELESMFAKGGNHIGNRKSTAERAPAPLPPPRVISFGASVHLGQVSTKEDKVHAGDGKKIAVAAAAVTNGSVAIRHVTSSPANASAPSLAREETPSSCCEQRSRSPSLQLELSDHDMHRGTVQPASAAGASALPHRPAVIPPPPDHPPPAVPLANVVAVEETSTLIAVTQPHEAKAPSDARLLLPLNFLHRTQLPNREAGSVPVLTDGTVTQPVIAPSLPTSSSFKRADGGNVSPPKAMASVGPAVPQKTATQSMLLQDAAIAVNMSTVSNSNSSSSTLSVDPPNWFNAAGASPPLTANIGPTAEGKVRNPTFETDLQAALRRRQLVGGSDAEERSDTKKVAVVTADKEKSPSSSSSATIFNLNSDIDVKTGNGVRKSSSRSPSRASSAITGTSEPKGKNVIAAVTSAESHAAQSQHAKQPVSVRISDGDSSNFTEKAEQVRRQWLAARKSDPSSCQPDSGGAQNRILAREASAPNAASSFGLGAQAVKEGAPDGMAAVVAKELSQSPGRKAPPPVPLKKVSTKTAQHSSGGRTQLDKPSVQQLLQLSAVSVPLDGDSEAPTRSSPVESSSSADDSAGLPSPLPLVLPPPQEAATELSVPQQSSAEDSEQSMPFLPPHLTAVDFDDAHTFPAAPHFTEAADDCTNSPHLAPPNSALAVNADRTFEPLPPAGATLPQSDSSDVDATSDDFMPPPPDFDAIDLAAEPELSPRRSGDGGAEQSELTLENCEPTDSLELRQSHDPPTGENRRLYTSKHVEAWTVHDVGDWLDSLGLAEYRQVFADNCVEGEILISLTREDVKELGMDKVGHRVKFEKEVKKLARVVDGSSNSGSS